MMVGMFDTDNAPITVAVLGSTGSVGRQTLEIARAHPDRFRIIALAAGMQTQELSRQADEFRPELIGAVGDGAEGPSATRIITGSDSAAAVAEECEADVVLNAVVGAAGLHATIATLKSGKVLALANKESLVAAGEYVMGRAGPGQIRPVDSEHSALWQALEGIPSHLVRRAILTGSGGPFRGLSREELGAVTVEQALAHPVWQMGPKITIDSATLMNKGLEVIEAHFLFGLTYDEIDVVIHPQGIIHALAETVDGALIAHAAEPDMRLPIQVALAWPERIVPPGGKRVDLTTIKSLGFEPPDLNTFTCLRIAYEAGRKGDTYPAVLNAANEIAVQAFLEGKIRFLHIPQIVEAVLEDHTASEASLEGVLEADSWARGVAQLRIGDSQ